MDGIILKNLNLCSRIVFCGFGFNKRLLPSLLLVPPKRCWFGLKSQEPEPLRFNPANLGTSQQYGKLLALHHCYCVLHQRQRVFQFGSMSTSDCCTPNFISTLWGSTKLHSEQSSVHWCMCCANLNPELGAQCLHQQYLQKPLVHRVINYLRLLLLQDIL